MDMDQAAVFLAGSILTAIGFIVPLDSLSQWVMSDLIGTKQKEKQVTDDTEETQSGKE
jgi:outer membrane biogenesis lipoprotein LolB